VENGLSQLEVSKIMAICGRFPVAVEGVAIAPEVSNARSR